MQTPVATILDLQYCTYSVQYVDRVCVTETIYRSGT